MIGKVRQWSEEKQMGIKTAVEFKGADQVADTSMNLSIAGTRFHLCDKQMY